MLQGSLRGIGPDFSSWLDGTDSHLYFGWYHGKLDGLASALRAVPRLARFVTEFGAQAVPDSAAFMEPERWPELDWDRLLRRFGAHWRVLLSYLCLFGFVYPCERTRIPLWVMTALMERLEEEIHAPPPAERICQGTLISREQYLPDLKQWGFEDARLTMTHAMTEAEIAEWTRAIAEKN